MAEKLWSGRKILIVDDSKAVREALKSSYASLGLQVVGLAENGLVGLHLVRELRPDIVNLDIIMPEMDGLECYRKIRAFDAHVKCLINSWLSGEAKVVSGLSELIPAYLFQPKTMTPSLLEARLEILFDPLKQSLARAPASVAQDFGDDIADLGIKVS